MTGWQLGVAFGSRSASAVAVAPGGKVLSLLPADEPPKPTRDAATRDAASPDALPPVGESLRAAVAAGLRAFGDSGPERAVVTHPFAWSPDETAALRAAVLDAGLSEAEVIATPVALARGFRARFPLPVGTCLAVLDIGPGGATAVIVRRDQDGPAVAADSGTAAPLDQVLTGLPASGPLVAMLLTGPASARAGVRRMVGDVTGLPVMAAGASPAAPALAALCTPREHPPGTHLNEPVWDTPTILAAAARSARRQVQDTSTAFTPPEDAVEATLRGAAGQPPAGQVPAAQPPAEESADAPPAGVRTTGAAVLPVLPREPHPPARPGIALPPAEPPPGDDIPPASPGGFAPVYPAAGRSRGGRSLLAAAALVVLLGALGGVWLLGRSSAPVRTRSAADHPTALLQPSPPPTGPPTMSGEPPVQTSAPAQQPAPTPTEGALPAGWSVRQETGFSLAVPSGWQRSTEPGSVFYQDSTGQLLVQVSTTDWSGDPQAQAASVARTVSGEFSGYQEIGITPTTYRDQPAADLEFIFDHAGTTSHALDRFFHIGGQAYAVYFRMPAQQWSGSPAYLNAIFGSFTIG